MKKLIDYAIEKKLITEDDREYCMNRLIRLFGTDRPAELTDGQRFSSGAMDCVMPAPHEVREMFSLLCETSPEKATEWYYSFCKDTFYVRDSNMKWDYEGKYGTLEISINLAKPEKDPKDIAAAGKAAPSGYPKCQLCPENEGWLTRENMRIIPLEFSGAEWYFQYSPYVYYNEHCIVLNKNHVPMKINRETFVRLFDFLDMFPHYFIGSNADLPIVGGSILSHDHFQGGNHVFPMMRAAEKKALTFDGFEDVQASVIDWPMSVIKLAAGNRYRLEELAGLVLASWVSYTDEDAFIFAETGGVRHSTVTPIARKSGGNYELYLVLRNNITTDEYPLGLYHPHPDKWHVKKENIGLIEVMGLAILPPRLIPEIDSGRLSEEEIGRVFESVLEDAGVFKNDASFMKFLGSIHKQ